MSYLLTIAKAIFRPRAIRRQMSCAHPDEWSHMIDAGMSKVFRCPDCGLVSFAHTSAVY